MIEYEDRCSGCDGIYRQCANCSARNVKVFYCDACGVEIDPDEVYQVDDYHLCEDCLKKEFKYKD